MIALRLAQKLPRSLLVEWEDGLAANFTYVWLRDNSERRPSLLHLDLQSKPEVVEYSFGSLSVVWPPFLSSSYSSSFLRHHASSSSLTKVHTSSTQSSLPVNNKTLLVPWQVAESTAEGQRSLHAVGHLASFEWTEGAYEASTIWPQLQKIPSLCTVQVADSHTKSAKVNLVDAASALAVMSATHPREFVFLTSASVEYTSGLFTATHPVATLQDGRVVGAVFNNELRSPHITVESIETLYASLKTFHKICLQLMHTVQLERGMLLMVDNTKTLIGAPAQAGRRLHLKVYN